MQKDDAMSELTQDIAAIVDARASRRMKEEAAKDIQSAKDYAEDLRKAAIEDREEAEQVLRRARMQVQKDRNDLAKEREEMETRFTNRERALRVEKQRQDDLAADLAATDRDIAQKLDDIRKRQVQATQELEEARSIQDRTEQRAQEIEDKLMRMNEIWRPST